MSETISFGRLVSRVTDAASTRAFPLALEDVESGTGRLIGATRADYSGGGIALLPGDLLFGRLRPYLAKTWVADRHGEAVGEFDVFRPSEHLSPRYGGYLLLSEALLGPVVAATNGAKMPRADWDVVRNVKLSLPSVRQQEMLADYLDRETAQIDALIGKQGRLIETLRERRRALVAGLLEEVHGRPTWVSSLAVRGGFHDGDWVESKDQDPAGPIRLLQLADVGDGRFRNRSDRRVNEETFQRLRCSPVQAGDVLIARMPDPLGRACLVPQGLGRTITVVDVAVLRVDERRFDKRFVVYSLNEHGFRKRLESLQDGATRQRIPRKVLGRQVVNMPPLEAQRRAADALDEKGTQIDELVAKAEQFIALAWERRAALITAAVTGQIDVRAAA